VKSLFITGSTGFVGRNIIQYFNSKFEIFHYLKNTKININQDIVLHIAGKAHDLKNTSTTQDYYIVNTELTKNLFDNFLISNAKVFITLSSVKAVADELDCELTEDYIPNPITHYGKSKLLAEQYILSKIIPSGKKVFILRPCMIHGPGNKGNLNSIYKIISKGFPWPLGAFENKRSFCSIDNLCFVINELINNEMIPSGIYNVSDDEPVSTNHIIYLINHVLNKRNKIIIIPKIFILFFTKIGDYFKWPLNTENLKKLTENYIVSNTKIKQAMNKNLPISAEDGLIKTILSFK
jgi:nucleoside-diphosphate-sugar epimerase